MMYTMPKNLLSICVNFALATQPFSAIFSEQQKTGSLLPAFPSLFPFQLLSAPRPLRARRGADD